MKKIINSTHLEGYLFAHSLEHRTSGPESKNPGTEFIRGTLEIATDDEAMNVVPVSFSYVTAKTKKGADNATYKTLAGIIDSTGNTWADAGANALKVRVDTAMGLNDFCNQQGEMVSIKQNDGGFVHTTNMFTGDRNRFEADVLITNVIEKEADEDKGTPEMVIVKGATFNFMGSILPVDFVVKSDAGRKFFLDLEAAPGNPVFTKVWGKIVSTTVETQVTEESGFGEPSVKTSVRKIREWEITGVAPAAYDYGDEAVLTKDEVAAAIAARETHLADVKTRWEARQNSNGAAAPAGAAPAATGDFSF